MERKARLSYSEGMEKLYKEIIQMIAIQFEIEPELVSKDTNLELDLGADSVDMIMFVIEIENRYSVNLPDEQLANFYSPEKAVEYLKDHL